MCRLRSTTEPDSGLGSQAKALKTFLSCFRFARLQTGRRRGDQRPHRPGRGSAPFSPPRGAPRCMECLTSILSWAFEPFRTLRAENTENPLHGRSAKLLLLDGRRGGSIVGKQTGQRRGDQRPRRPAGGSARGRSDPVRFRFGVWGLGFGVWGLGFGVWGLGFGKFRSPDSAGCLSRFVFLRLQTLGRPTE